MVRPMQTQKDTKRSLVDKKLRNKAEIWACRNNLDQLSNNADFKKLTTDETLKELINNDAFKELITSPPFTNLILNPAFVEIIKVPDFTQLINHGALEQITEDCKANDGILKDMLLELGGLSSGDVTAFLIRRNLEHRNESPNSPNASDEVVDEATSAETSSEEGQDDEKSAKKLVQESSG
ncbi:MAG: hypothetical protein LQ346_007200 [Caloplaca aetnensis]|nr:MAG: hypothetical protein LQ346_007200 [Caloplaca aetnensis]